MNFASPKVGTALVPDLPPLPFYTHVGTPLQTAFYEYNEWYPHRLVRHSILNLQTVLNHAVRLTPQVWTGYLVDGGNPTFLMISVTPPAGEHSGIVKALSEVKQRELAVER